ncbi:MAG: alcohol dehydrogenase catalytic domain-containing protein [Victivallaceae bacterium]|nr:alcohol dehydrogenase catalytic domain-containing protein [Victivallaceae bacterium]
MSNVKTLATVIERPGEAAFREVTLTPKRADTVICRTVMSAISTGTDMKTYHGMQHPEQCYYPLVPGYENIGVVVEEGSYAPGFKKGDRVMINECRKYLDCCAAWGGGTLLVHKDSDNAGGAGDPLCKIPDNVSDRDAVLAYLFCVSLKGVERLGLTADYTGTVLVFGAGMNGLGAAMIIKIKSPRATVVVAEPNPFRREIAAHYADHVITPDAAGLAKLLEITNGKKADKIIECSGNPTVPGMLYMYIKDGGWTDDDEPGYIHLNGDYPEKLLFDHYHRWFVKNVNMSMTCAMKWRGKGQILQWISEGKIDTSHLPCETWPAGKAKEAFEYQSKKDVNCFKILFDWRDL